MVLRQDLLHLSRPRIVPLGSLPPVLPRWYAFGLCHVVRTRECLLLEVEEHQGRGHLPDACGQPRAAATLLADSRVTGTGLNIGGSSSGVSAVGP